MPQTQAAEPNRVIFLDNLRWLFVAGVVLQHAANAYRNLAWWPVNNPAASPAAVYLSAFLDAFTMPLLFFIAGYFALPTIAKKGPARFISGKLKRLGRNMGRRRDWKKAIVTLKEGSTIEFFEGV